MITLRRDTRGYRRKGEERMEIIRAKQNNGIDEKKMIMMMVTAISINQWKYFNYC